MQVPSIPTDNLYKTQAMCGALLAATSIVASLGLVQDLGVDVARAQGRTERLESAITRMDSKSDLGLADREAFERLREEHSQLVEELPVLRERATTARAHGFFLLAAFGFGVWLMFRGFNRWHDRWQRHLDVLVEARAATAKRKAAEPLTAAVPGKKRR